MKRKRVKQRGTNTHVISSAGNIGTKRILTSKDDGKNINQSTDQKCTCNSDDQAGDLNILPHWIPWILFPLTLGFRVWHVLDPHNWWILHPDEVFQTIEVAHTDAYGYGFRAYEYLPPPGACNDSSLSDAQKLEADLGMFSLRSFLLPKLLSSVMLIADRMGVGASPFLVIKVFHSAVSSLLPLAIYWFTKSWLRSKEVASLSAVFVSSSLILNLFGTHTFINSFISPFVFISLVPLVQTLVNLKEVDSSQKNRLAVDEGIQYSGMLVNSCALLTHQTKTETNSSTVHNQDENANIVYVKDAETRVSKLSASCLPNHINIKTVSFLGLSSLLNMCAVIIETSYHFGRHFNFMNLVSGMVLAACIYTRLDVILIPVSLVLMNLKQFKTLSTKVELSNRINYIVGLTLGIVLGGSLDYFTYGVFLLSPWQWFKFNMWNRSAGAIFGTNSFMFYLTKLCKMEPLFALVCLSLVLYHVVYFCCFSKFRKINLIRGKGRHHRVCSQSFMIFIGLLFCYSCNSHKELRFTHNAVVLLYISFACAIYGLLKSSAKVIHNQRFCNLSTYVFILIFVSSHFNSFLHMSKDGRREWSYGNDIDSHDVNNCLDYVRLQSDVTGVFVDYPVHMTGAYSVLHKAVPVFVRKINEYMEYGDSNPNHISVFGRISDFVSIYNVQYMYRLLVEKPVYNYLIVTQNLKLSDLYELVHKQGKFNVWRRNTDDSKVHTNDGQKIFIGSNATLLEHEGYWLKHLGLYDKAEQRLIAANRLEPTRIGVFRLLLEIYFKLNQTEDYNSVMLACRQVHSTTKCLYHHVSSELHSEYYQRK